LRKGIHDGTGGILMATTKRLRILIDFSIEIADTPPPLPPGTIEPPDPEYDDRQARLLEAVKNHPEFLTAWLQDLVAGEMYREVGTYWYDALLGGEQAYRDILAPAIATLSEEDLEFFNEADQEGFFEECIDMFRQSFVVKKEPPVIVEQG
jgi:hypothetical protein